MQPAIDQGRPHYTTLCALFLNQNLDAADLARRDEVMVRYNSWRTSLQNLNIDNYSQCIRTSVALLNDYKNFIDIDFSADGANNAWLYRNRGQTKHSSSILEEFMIIMVNLLFSQLLGNWFLGPKKTVFNLDLRLVGDDNFEINSVEKDVDFAIYREFSLGDRTFAVSKLGLELKDHVDKTMLSGVSTDANIYHTCFPNGFYGLVAGWRDLGPDSYQPLRHLDCFTLLRKAKRISAPRTPTRLREFWNNNPYQADVFEHLFDHVRFSLEQGDTEYTNWIANISGRFETLSVERTRVNTNHTTIDTNGWVH
mgnify:CR=1 FL=1